MSLQGPVLVVSDNPAAAAVEALSAAGAFPVIETKWPDAPTAFVSVKPGASFGMEEMREHLERQQIATQRGHG